MDEFGMEYHLQMFAELAVKDGVFKRKCVVTGDRLDINYCQIQGWKIFWESVSCTT